MRILIVKTSSMGDVVHAQPLAVDLRAAYPHAHIDWVCEAPFAAIPAMNPAVNHVIPMAWRRWRRSLWAASTQAAMREFVRQLRAQPYDWVIDCQGLLKSAAVARLARSRARVGLAWGSAREPWASWAYSQRVPVPWAWHVVARNRALASALTGRVPMTPADFGLQAPCLDLPWLQVDQPYAVLISGASRPAKWWPQAHWQALARWLAEHGLAVLWLWGSPAEHAQVQAMAAAGADAVTGIIPPFLSVAEAGAVVHRARLVIGLDTGLTHLAGALGRPTVGIFCDFDATQCAVSGAGPCASLGGVGCVPTVDSVVRAARPMLATASVQPSAAA